jgi:hypothetical protein
MPLQDSPELASEYYLQGSTHDPPQLSRIAARVAEMSAQDAPTGTKSRTIEANPLHQN